MAPRAGTALALPNRSTLATGIPQERAARPKRLRGMFVNFFARRAAEPLILRHFLFLVGPLAATIAAHSPLTRVMIRKSAERRITAAANPPYVLVTSDLRPFCAAAFCISLKSACAPQ